MLYIVFSLCIYVYVCISSCLMLSSVVGYVGCLCILATLRSVPGYTGGHPSF